MKTPKPRKLKSGTWFIQMRLNGVSVPVSAPTKQECIYQAQLIKAEHKANKRQISPSNSTITLTQAIDGYIATKSNSLSPSTVRGYRTIQKARFQKYMNTQIHNIRDWQAVYNSEIGRLSPKTLNNSFGFIQSVAKHYGVQMPSVDKKTAVRKERPFLDYSEILKFCDAIQGKEWEQDALFALHSLRVSEILGLRWEDVDLDKGIIHVRGAVVRDENNQRIRKETTKTAASRRDIPIFIPRLTVVLTERKRKKKPLLFYSSPDKLSAVIEKTCKAAQITPVIAALLRDALVRAAEVPELREIVGRMTLREGDSIRGLRELETPPEVILLDPMFPARRKSGLIGKKLQLLQRLEAPCADEAELLDAAIAAGPRKVVVKRPLKGPYLADRKPAYSIRGKAVRYDCIVPPHGSESKK